jgi:glycosyltransferase involved in cell wall biosynthesis
MPDSPPPTSPPLVSVVINNYNYGRFVGRAIDSALTQTYPITEVIVVDDGSTDDSREAITSYGGRVRTVLKKNGGQASAFNAGFDASRGELIALLDSDDEFLPDKVERCVRAAQANPFAQLIYHRVQTVDADGKPRGKPTPPKLYSGSIARRVRRGGGTWYYAPTSAQVYRREFLKRIFPVPEAPYRTSADAYVACLAGMLAEVAAIEQPLTRYRVHGANAWAAGDHDERRRLDHYIRRFEIENAALNEALNRLGSPVRASTRDNFAYQLYRRLTGRGGSLARLIWLVLRDSSEMSLRTKMFAANLPKLLRTEAQTDADATPEPGITG